MHAVIVASGELPAGADEVLSKLLSSADIIIAADGGLIHCDWLGVQPDHLVGDLDSAPAELIDKARQSGVDVQQYPPAKDETDLELALKLAVTSQASSVTVMAPFGGRLDHELATIGLLASPTWRELDIHALDARRQMWVVHDHVELARSVGETISLVPWGNDVHGVTTMGLEWVLTDAILPLGTTRGISNVATAETQSVTVSSGTLLVLVG